MSGLMVPEPPSQTTDMETWISSELSVSSSCGNSISGRISTSGITAELRPLRVCDLRTIEEVSSTRTTWLERVTTGVGSIFPGHPHRSELAWQVAATYLSWRCGFHDFLPEIHYLLNSESTQIARVVESRLLRQAKYDTNPNTGNWPKLGTTPSLNQSGSGKLARSQIYVCKISLANAIASSSASIDYRNQRMQSNCWN